MKRVLQLFLFVPFLYFGSKTLAQDTIVISHPETNVQAGVTFCLDIKANQFEDLLGIQFALAWDESVLTYQNIEVNQPNSTDPYLPNLNAVNFGIQGGVARFVWTEQGSSPITLAENSTLFQICFKANESGNTALRLSDDIVGEAVKASNFSIIPVVGQNSTINVNEDGDDLGAARIKIADKTITARDQFCVPVTADQFGSLVGLQFQIEWDERLLELKDVRPNQALLDEITPTSLSTSRRDLKFSWLEPSLTSLEIPDNSVLFELCFESTFDYATTTEIGFGEAVPFEATRIEAGTPVVFPVLLESSSITIESEQVVAEAQLAIASKTVNSGESFCLPITAAGFESLTSLQFSLEWDDSVLAYTGIAFYEDPLGMSYQQTPSYIEAADEFKLIWWSGDDNLNVIVADDTPLFELCFDAIGEAAVETLVEFNESIPLEATRVEEGVLLEIPVNTEDGVIQISRSNNSSASLSIADQAVESGASFCLPITANRFGSVTGMQFSLDWDEELLQYDQVKLGQDVLNLNETNYNYNGEALKFLWLNYNTQNVSLPSNSVLFELCFIATGENQETTVTVGETLPLEVYRIQQNTIQPIRVETKEGIVRIGENTLQEAAKVIVSDANVLPEAAFCLPIVAQQVGQPVGLQFALDWDENLLDLEEVKLNNALFDSDNISIYNAETAGRLRFVWTDIIELNSINLQDSITLLELCFQANGEIGTQTTVSFEESTPFEAIQLDNEGNIQPIAVELKNGVINFLTNNVDVLPGDTDVDGEVSHYDLINIGLGHGETGPARANASLAFTPQAAEDWANSTPITNINYKHADTDGNGLIDRDDLLAIEQNWTLAPTLFNTVVTEDGIPFYVDIDTVRLVENQQVPVILGAADQLAKDIYGLAFSIYYESEAMLENGFGVSTEQSWLGTSEELIQVQRFFPAEKRVDVAISRIDQNGRDGFGELLALDIVMEDVILFEPGDIEFRIDHVKAVGDVEQNITFNTKDDQDKQSLTNTNQQVVPKIKIYPNPATDVLYINSKDLDIQQIEVYDLFGRLLLQYTASEQIDVSAWKSGLYFIHIKTDQGNMSKKINIQ